MNKKYIGSFLASLAITLFASTGCFAESWGGREDFTAGGWSGYGDSGGYEHGTFWFHYKFLETSDTQGREITITPQWNNGTKAPVIDGTCAAPDVGFWLLANASNGSKGEPSDICVSRNETTRNNVANALGVDAGTLKLDGTWFYRSEIGCNSAKNSDGSYTTYLPVDNYGKTNEGSFYINQHGKGWSAYDTLSANNVSYDKINYDKDKTVAGQKYYNKKKEVYENDRIATSFDDVAKDFKIFSRIDSASNDLDDNASLDDVWKQMQSEKIYAFCSFKNDQKTSLESKSEIELYQGGAKKTEKISDGWGKTSTAGEIELDNNSDIVLKYRFAYRRGEDTKFATSSIANDSTITVYRSGGSNYVSTSATTPGFKIGVRELSVIHENIEHEDEGGVKVSLAGLAINTPYTFCATISHSSQLTVSGSNTVGSGSANSGACVVIKIKPPVTAEVDSDTLAMISSSKLAPGYTKTTFSSHEAGGADKSIEFTGSNAAKVIPGDMTIDWAHYMGYRDLSDASTTVKSIYGLNNGGLTRSTTLGTYSNPSIPNGYNLEKITTKTGVFPGETRAYVYSIQHPSRVDVLTGQRASDAGPDETSSVKLGLYAEPVTCGLDDLHSYPIGVDNPYDYRWLSLSRTSSEYNHNHSTLTLGDGFSDYGEMWLTPTDKIMTNQVACFGSQIAEDASYKEADRFSKNRWVNETVDNRETDTVHNRQFTLVSELPEALFTGNNLANRTGSHTKQSFRASEIGVTNFSNASTPQSRIDARYELRAPSVSDIMVDAKKEKIGKSLTTTFRKPTQDGGINGPAVTMVAKIPYNYSLKLGLNGETDADTNILDSDDDSAFEGVVTSTGRVNKLVCAGHKDGVSGSCDEYVTRTRETQASMLIFTMNANFSYFDLKNNNEFSVEGSKLDESDLKTAISNHYGADYVDNPSINYEHSSNSVVIDESDSFAAQNITLGPTSVNPTDYAVGTKICAVLAAYPSDSHNTGDGRGIEINENQDAAFDGYGGELKTKYKVGCRTVAKRQTMSVEGNGVVSTGAISSSQTKYVGRVFKSWSEYQVVAGTVAFGKTAVSSGAVTAYDMASPAKEVNEVKDNISDYSVPHDWFRYPQSLGNYSTPGKPKSAEEAKANWGYSEKLINTIKKKYGEKAPDVGNINLTQTIVNQYIKDTTTIRSSGTITITENLHIPSGSERLIIIAKNIYIDRDVTEVNAWLIVDGEDAKNAGEFNTCAGYNINDEDYSDNNDNNYGNSHILQNCNKALLINGPVIIKTSTERDSGRYKPVQFPRTYGGGSRFNDFGQIERDEKSFAQRAEIFNYDPSVVEWAYSESKKDPQIVTTYTETLAPRL